MNVRVQYIQRKIGWIDNTAKIRDVGKMKKTHMNVLDAKERRKIENVQRTDEPANVRENKKEEKNCQKSPNMNFSKEHAEK